MNEELISKGGIGEMTEDTKIILDRLDKMDAKITDIQLTLENETNRNIRIIAEDRKSVV